MYTEGIRKIYTVESPGNNQSTIEKKASEADYNAYTINGRVWVRGKDGLWVESPFTVRDFSCN